VAALAAGLTLASGSAREKMPALRRCCWCSGNLAGHLSVGLVCWMFDYGIMPLYTPVGGAWLNMAESIQRIIKRRALECQHLQSGAFDHRALGS
jgi:hypothetical protein